MTRSDFVDDAVRGWRQIRPDINVASLEVVQHLIWSGRLADDILERTAIASGLRRRGDYEVLVLLRRSEPSLLTPLEVAEKLHTSPSGMTAKLDRLENLGLITRTQDTDDRRVIRLGITDTGRTMSDTAFDTSLKVYEAMLDTLTPAEAQTLNGLLNKLLKRLDNLSELRQR